MTITTPEEADVVREELRGLLRERPGIYTAKGRRLIWLAKEYAAYVRETGGEDTDKGAAKHLAKLLLRDVEQVVQQYGRAQ